MAACCFQAEAIRSSVLFPLLSYILIIHHKESVPNSSCPLTITPIWDTGQRLRLNIRPRAKPSWDLSNPSPPTDYDGEKYLFLGSLLCSIIASIFIKRSILQMKINKYRELRSSFLKVMFFSIEHCILCWIVEMWRYEVLYSCRMRGPKSKMKKKCSQPGKKWG